MSGTGTCSDIRVELGVYVLGAIAPADRAKVVGHLAVCERCREELAELAALPALLRKLPDPPETAQPALAPPSTLISHVARRRRQHQWLVAAAVTALAGVAGSGWAWQLSSSGSGRGAAAVALTTAKVGPVTVLANDKGFTLYWFEPDSATASRCTGSCAVHWPPVAGPATARTGLGGEVGTITRPDGSIQATYDGHPLYTASLDTAPGQARGNNLDVSGGIWHEVVVSGSPAPPAGSSPSEPSGY